VDLRTAEGVRDEQSWRKSRSGASYGQGVSIGCANNSAGGFAKDRRITNGGRLVWFYPSIWMDCPCATG
jgi:hypothetical protein